MARQHGGRERLKEWRERDARLLRQREAQLARLPLKYFANAPSFFVQRMYAKPES